jgi:hypothetical protein
MRRLFISFGLLVSFLVGAFGMMLVPLSTIAELKTLLMGDRTHERSGNQSKMDKLGSPFMTAFAGTPKKVRAYEELTPGFWVGFDETKAAAVYVVQKTDSARIGGPENKYLIDVDIMEAAGSDWVTIERAIEKPGISRVVVALTARMTQPGQVNFVLFVPQIGRPPQRIPLGTADIGTDFGSFILEKSVDLRSFPNLDVNYPARVVALLPTHAGMSMELARFDIFSL